MVCIYCSSKTSIINSRHWSRNNSTWRRRQCGTCNAVFTTTEIPSYESLWTILDSPTKSIEPFSRDKLYLSVYECCKHRTKAIDDASGLTDTIVNKSIKIVSNGSIEKSRLKQIAFLTLKNFDSASAVFYNAYHGPI